MTQQITTEWLVSMGCQVNCYVGGSCTAFSHNGYIVANKFGRMGGKWRLANRSKNQWKQVKLRVKAISMKGDVNV
jgi:hypothetical protein